MPLTAVIPKMCGDVKHSLIDLEAGDTATGRKQTLTMQRERLSERGIMYCVYWIRNEDHFDVFSEGYIGISKNFKERMRGHKKNRQNKPLTQAIQKYSWDTLIKEILYSDLSLEEALAIEAKLREKERVGWNLQRGGFIGVDSSWYTLQENKIQHSKATSECTKLGILKKDTKQNRSIRAKNNWVVHKDSYKDISKGSSNPRAILNEDQVKEIKYKLIPFGYKDREIAQLFNVKPYVINFIRIGKNWRHI